MQSTPFSGGLSTVLASQVVIVVAVVVVERSLRLLMVNQSQFLAWTLRTDLRSSPHGFSLHGFSLHYTTLQHVPQGPVNMCSPALDSKGSDVDTCLRFVSFRMLHKNEGSRAFPSLARCNFCQPVVSRKINCMKTLLC